MSRDLSATTYVSLDLYSLDLDSRRCFYKTFFSLDILNMVVFRTFFKHVYCTQQGRL